MRGSLTGIVVKSQTLGNIRSRSNVIFMIFQTLNYIHIISHRSTKKAYQTLAGIVGVRRLATKLLHYFYNPYIIDVTAEFIAVSEILLVQKAIQLIPE